ncbi:MAG: ferritin family protein [Candidatus Omnitrophica bacterium]|nr:ferritin family protein [Candidatus Omnitrophota bacterium]MBU1924372.1 ferritin family protein [Candidatus Omnitrophota bacterium]
MMNTLFNPREIVNVAIKVEENGKVLYGILENKTRSENLRKTWAHLKEQEEEHRKTFETMRDNIGDYIVHEFSPGAFDVYLETLASTFIFTEELIREKIKQLFNSEIEAVDFGIQIEKDSILTFSALKEYVIEGKKPVLGKIIDEEKRHLARLISLKEKLLKN